MARQHWNYMRGWSFIFGTSRVLIVNIRYFAFQYIQLLVDCKWINSICLIIIKYLNNPTDSGVIASRVVEHSITGVTQKPVAPEGLSHSAQQNKTNFHNNNIIHNCYPREVYLQNFMSKSIENQTWWWNHVEHSKTTKIALLKTKTKYVNGLIWTYLNHWNTTRLA